MADRQAFWTLLYFNNRVNNSAVAESEGISPIIHLLCKRLYVPFFHYFSHRMFLNRSYLPMPCWPIEANAHVCIVIVAHQTQSVKSQPTAAGTMTMR